MTNRKNTLVILIALFAVTFTFAQTRNSDEDKKPRPDMVYKKGDIMASASIGLLPGLVPVGKKALVMPVSARLDYRISKHISLGGYVGYSNVLSKPIIQSDGVVHQYNNKSLKAGLRAVIYNHHGKLNYYGGVMVGVNRENITRMQAIDYWTEPLTISGRQKDRGDQYQNIMPHLNGFVGINYFVLHNKAIFAEISSDVSLLNVGVRFKL